MMENKLFELQDEMYEYPYHYIPHFKDKDVIIRTQTLGWAIEYFSYLQVIIDWIEDLESTSILDVGCGDGRLINILSKEYPDKILRGIDLSEKAIDFAKCFSRNNAQFEVKNVEDIAEKYDVVTLIEVLEHIPDDYESNFLKEAYNRVRSGGNLLLSIPSNNRPLQDKHYRHYDKEYFDKLLTKNDITYTDLTYRYVFKKDLLYRIYDKLTNNRYYLLEFFFLNKIMWKYVENNLLDLSRNEGLHMLVNIKVK